MYHFDKMIKKYVFTIYFVFLLIASGGAWGNSYQDYFQAIKINDAPRLAELLGRGFDPNTLSPEAQHGLYLALREGALGVADLLIRHPQTQHDHRNAANESPLMMAALKGHAPQVLALIRGRGEVNKPGWAPLHYAASYPGPAGAEVVRLLLEHHAFINAESPNGSTPLMMAAQYGSEAVVDLLLQEGAEPHARNQLGLGPADFALRAGRQALAQSLSQRAAEALRQGRPAGRW